MNECINPGTSCSTDADCALDEYCEETVGSCLPIPDSNCEYHPPVGEFTPIVEWAWPDENDPPPMPDYVDVLTPPAVGDMDGDGIPEVGIVSYWDSCVGGGWNTGVLTILRGDTGALLLQHDDPSRRLRSNISPAMGDVDLDGDAEVLVGGADNTIYCYEIDGTLTWESSVPASQANGGIGIADLDVDGVPEVYMGATIFDNRGVLICEGTGGTGGGGGRGFSTAADLDLDGDLELVGGNTAYHHDCSIMWQSGEAGDGYPGVADIYDASGLPGTDGYPEVALIYSGNLQIISGQDGSLLWEVALPGSGYGGAPNISDFDGDGLVEIGTAGGAYMVVFDPDGTEPILWQQPTQDTSSARTGSTVFDFEGDGEAEIVYSDECFVRIYKGSDGTVLFEESNNTRTQHEYPIVVDIDADGNSELVVTANVCVWNCDAYPDWSGPPKRGVKVYGDEDLNWVRTRKVWNQHTYHVTNINDDCSIPSPETANWSAPGLNNFRQNVQTWGVHNAPNMAGDMFGGDPRNCGVGGSIDLGLMVLNQGSKGVPAGINIGFYRVMDNDDVVFLGAAQTTAPLLPGMNEYVEYTWQIPADETPLPSSFTFLAVVDDPAVGEVAIHECVETDNEVGPVEVICDTVE
jgi:outer membrane protein assembly factor BamB